MKTKGTNKVLTIDPTKFAECEVRIGPDSRGPSKCLLCQRTFKEGQVWQRMKSLPDPEFGAYFIGVHTKCPACGT